ncbi:MAG: YqjF family protein [Betaproteobacteria bacterium]
MAHDFDFGILREVEHRPWPMPDRAWIMTQTWHDLLFAHWPCELRALAAVVPAPLELDLHDGRPWIGIVPFRMTNVAPRGMPAPRWMSEFPELNVRTYVRAAGKAGVYFFSLDAANRLAVAAARALFGLPYHFANMQVEESNGTIRYRSRRARGDAEFIATYAPNGTAFEPQPGTLEYFLTERYCLHTVDSKSRVRTVDIHHAPWALQPAAARIDANSMAAAAGLALPDRAPLLHFAKRQDAVAWAPRYFNSAGGT